MRALLTEGFVGLLSRAVARRHLVRLGARLASEHYMANGAWPSHEQLLDALLYAQRGTADAARTRAALRTWRLRNVGRQLGRWWSDADARVLLGCAVLLVWWMQWG